MPSEDIARLVLLGIVATLILRWNLWRAVLFVKPEAMRLEPDAPADQMKVPFELEKAVTDLKALGFVALGTHTEKAPLSPRRPNFDFVHTTERAFCTVFASPKRGAPRLYFLTPPPMEVW